MGFKHSEVVQWKVIVGAIEPKAGQRCTTAVAEPASQPASQPASLVYSSLLPFARGRYAYPPYEERPTAASMQRFVSEKRQYLSLKGLPKEEKRPKKKTPQKERSQPLRVDF